VLDDLLMTVMTLQQYAHGAREAARSTGLDVAHASFANDPETVGQWLTAAADAAKSRNYLLAAEDDASTLYLWMNEPTPEPNSLTISAFAMGPARSARDPFDWRDALIGGEIGDLRIAPLSLAGMTEALALLGREDHTGPAKAAVEDLIVAAAFDLVASGLSRARSISLRIAMSRGEESRVCTWEGVVHEGQVHVWNAGKDSL
jgi:hypothetical protein